MSCRPMVALAILLLGGLPVYAPIRAHADGAPMWASPEGLTPGLPNTRVQMTSEDVHVKVQENAGGVYADVAATFDLLNTGPTVQMLVGFPDFTGIVAFNSAKITNFRAWTDATDYSASERTVGGGQFAGLWFVWNMVFPGTKTIRLQVAYNQPLTRGAVSSDLVPVSYVLRTGALWAGPIGHATVTMTAPNGGALLPPVSVTLPDGASQQVLAPTSADSSQLTWNLSNFTPSQDIEARFMLPATWSALQAAETAADAPNATADNLANGAQLILSTFSRELSGSYGTHYLPLATSWTQRALEADPSSASAWEAAGDVAWITAPRMLSFLHCWPATATEGYRRAVDLGSASAVPKLADLELRHVQSEDAGRALDDCAPPQGLTLPQAAPVAPVASNSPGMPTSDQSQIVSCGEMILPNTQGTEAIDCDDGSGYLFNPAFGWAGPANPTDPRADVTGPSWQTTSTGPGTQQWLDPDRQRVCQWDINALPHRVECHPAST